MGGHHKKNLRAEKAKVKLKGIKLPKGLNVTKTDFKVRKITIRDQLSAAQIAAANEGIANLRNVNLKETLSRLKHHSSSFRLEALRSLRDAIAVGHAGLGSQLGEIVQGVAAACLDIEKDTRRESFKTLSALLAALEPETVAPFFHVISSYLRCAMTHIQASLQEDALLMLDVLLQHVPRLVAAHSAKIFQNFLEMISRVRAEGGGERGAGRTLTVNMGSKQTTIKWRSQVLARLQQMLQTLVIERNGSDVANAAVTRSALTHTFAVKEPQHFSLKRASGGACDLAAIFSRSVGADSGDVSGGSADSSDESQLLRGYVSHLMPLLLDAWLEVRPPSAQQVVLSGDAALTLKIVLGIIENLWTLVELHEAQVNHHALSAWFRQTYAEAFNVQLLQATAGAFPYQQTEAAVAKSKSKNKKSALPSSGGQFCLPQNLSLAYLMCRFYPNSTQVKKQSACFEALLRYLHTIISSTSRGGIRDLKTHDPTHLRHMDLALRALLHRNGAVLLQLHPDETRALLRVTIAAFLEQHFPPQEGIAGRVLVLLCDIAQLPALRDAFGATEFNEFLVYLPQLLLRPSISEAALVAMANLGKQLNGVFLDALVALAAAVITQIQRIQVSGAANAFEGKKHIMNLFYWTRPCVVWDAAQRAELVRKVDENVTDKRIAGYFKDILTQE